MAATSFTLPKTLPSTSVYNSASVRTSEASGIKATTPFVKTRRAGAFSSKNKPLVVRAQDADTKGATLTGVIFEPFQEVKGEIAKIPKTSDVSFARQRFSDACEAAINDQINIEYNISYVYHAMYAYFNRDNVGLPGFAKYFKEASDEERQHAEALMDYQNKRGGRVKLGSILMPAMEFDHPEKGEALYAMELALSLEKLNNEKLLHLHKVADENNDVQMAEYIESNFLGDQVNAINKVSQFVAQLRRVGKGHGVYHFDLELGQGTA